MRKEAAGGAGASRGSGMPGNASTSGSASMSGMSGSGGMSARPAAWMDTRKDFRRNWSLYLLAVPVVVFYAMFCYVPMYGVVIAFRDFQMKAGVSYFQNILNSPWVGLKYFQQFFDSRWFVRILRNTFTISFANIVFGFPAPIILALLVNEIRQRRFKRIVQTVTYLPHFISLVVVCGMIKDFTSNSGVISLAIAWLTGGKAATMLNNPALFKPIYVISDIWQGVGWGSIVYLAAIAGVDQQLYEAATIDGAGRLRQILHVTLPGILPIVVVMLILRMGGMLNVGYEKIILLSNPLISDASEVISSHTYARGLLGREWSYASAVGIFNSAINLFFLAATNYISRRVGEVSLW
ncbi:MAG: ABC transporter permease subunit [Clostridiales bacterium]|jgi:putative aldouronate transport system permease protein|nr:ABC transporter permease subunit [Clostridiales bacterium]